jgi:site-specific recombinase XerD
MASAKVIIREHANKKGLTNVYIRVVHNRRKIDIPIKDLKVTAANWGPNTFIGKPDPAILNYKLTNERLKGYELKATRVINKLAGENVISNTDISDLCNEICLACFNKNAAEQSMSFCQYTDKVIAQLKEAEKYGTAACYADAKSFIERRFGRDMQFQEITYQALKKMEAGHCAAGGGVNSLSFYMRTIRAIYNRAVSDKHASREFSPFLDYKIKSENTVKRAISIDNIKKIKNIELETNSALFRAQQYFLFSFYTRGMNFADMAYLKVNNISESRIEYRRAKTGKYFSIQLSPQISEILKPFLENKNPADFVFPILKSTDKPAQFIDIENERRNYNKMLVKLAQKAKIPESHLTSYVARHTWANAAKQAGVSVELISQGLGHSDVKTTEIYLDSFPNEVMDRTSDLVAALLETNLPATKQN